MSFSRNQQMLVYIPVTGTMLPTLRLEFPRLHNIGLVDDIFYALTDHCCVETLQIITVLQTVENYLAGQGKMFYLSALRLDRTGKMQTAEMRLLHDVMVEMPMNSHGYGRLQEVLSEHDMQFVMMHSCGSDVIPADRDSYMLWWDKIKGEQEMRTWLDWSTTTQPDENRDDVIAKTSMTASDFAVIDRIFLLSNMLALMLQEEAEQKLVA
jgi:hypothetical protein